MIEFNEFNECSPRWALYRPTSWDLVIGGFTQSPDRMTGSQRLWLRLMRFAGPRRMVGFYSWNHNWTELAERIAVVSEGQKPTIRIYGYSRGGGYGFPTLAAELRRRGLGVQRAVLADPVARWFAFVRGHQIRIPPTVGEVWYTLQTNSWPRGHRMVAEDPKRTKIHTPFVRLDLAHHAMDEDPLFHETAVSVAEGNL